MFQSKLLKTGSFSHGFMLLLPLMATVKTEAISYHYHTPTMVEQNGDSSVNNLCADSATAYTEKSREPKVQMNRHAAKFVKDFIRTDEEELQLVKDKSAGYFKTIESVFTKYNLPVQLKYLAVVESNLNSKAVSHVGAKGTWQLMPTTARELGLTVKSGYDERTHLYKSTVAAAKYLNYLYSQFGDWLLVLAAYNSGPGPVLKAMHRSGSKNFWALQAYLPAESRSHVKRFIATHYFFEEAGSVTTMTKAEATAFQKLVDAYELSQKETNTQTETAVVAVSE